MKLIICIVYFICTGSAVTGQDTSTPLATTTCCSTKSLGGVAFTLVKGNTIEGNGCLDDCVYERDDSPGGQYCFAKGNQMVECSNSETEFQGVNVTFSKRAESYTDWMSFNTTIGFINCTIKTVLPFVGPSEDVECSLTGLTPGESDSSTKRSTAGQERWADTNVFIYSTSEGRMERFSLHSPFSIFVNCFISTDRWICTKNPPTDYQTIYVEDAIKVVDMAECKELCDLIDCTFWTFSDLEKKDWTINDGHEKRNHNGESECGLRYYAANEMITTAKGQFCAKRGLYEKIYEDKVFVGKFYMPPMVWNEHDCLRKCIAEPLCNSWTFQYPPFFGPVISPLCVLNYGITERKIPVCEYITCGLFRGVIVSGNKTMHG